MRAMILAAGRGERMRPLTDSTPKPLLCIGGKPLIVWHLERLANAGIRDIIINHAWLGEQIEATLGEGEQWGVRLTYSPETSALETAGGIAKALPFFRGRPFLVVNGDVWCDWDPAQARHVVADMKLHCALGWLLLVDNPDHHPDGDFALSVADPPNDRGTIHPPHRVRADDTRDDRRHPSDSVLTTARVHARPSVLTRSLTFAGIGIYQPELFADVTADQPAALAPVLRTAIARDRIIGSHHQGDWVDVGTPERLQELAQRLARQGQARYTSN